MLKIKFPTKRIFRIFPILSINAVYCTKLGNKCSREESNKNGRQQVAINNLNGHIDVITSRSKNASDVVIIRTHNVSSLYLYCVLVCWMQ